MALATIAAKYFIRTWRIIILNRPIHRKFVFPLTVLAPFMPAFVIAQ